jgi:hypothetical protein
VDSEVDSLSCGEVKGNERWSALNSLGFVIRLGDDNDMGHQNDMIIDSGRDADSCVCESHLSGITKHSIEFQTTTTGPSSEARFFEALTKADNKGEDVLQVRHIVTPTQPENKLNESDLGIKESDFENINSGSQRDQVEQFKKVVKKLRSRLFSANTQGQEVEDDKKSREFGLQSMDLGAQIVSQMKKEFNVQPVSDISVLLSHSALRIYVSDFFNITQVSGMDPEVYDTAVFRLNLGIRVFLKIAMWESKTHVKHGDFLRVLRYCTFAPEITTSLSEGGEVS